MIRSLRWRMQLWYSGLLLVVIGGFGGILYYQACANKMQEIDAQLEAAALYLDATLRSFPDFELDGREPPPKGPRGKDKPDFECEGREPPPPKGPWGKDKKGPKFGPPPPPPPPPPRLREQLMADLDLPHELNRGPKAQRPYFAVWRENGSVLKTVGVPEKPPPSPPEEDVAPTRPRVAERGDYREARMMGPRHTHIIVGASVREEWAALHAFGLQLLGIGAAVLAVGLAGGFLFASRIVAPLAAMSKTASAISATNLSTRIDARKIDTELAGLAGVLNAMFARLEAAFERQTRFTADASHELRTPLAILRANAELALSQSRTPEEYRQTIEACLRAVHRMSNLVQKLLLLARADAGEPRAQFQPVLLEQLVTDCLTLVQPLAKEKGVALTADLVPVTVSGDADSLAQLIHNLLGNAMQYNHAGGTVHVRLTATGSEAVLTVFDTGPGIAEKDRGRIFERFFRVDKSRARASGGAGLGLAICKTIVEAHGGAIDFATQVNEGTTFRVKLPMQTSRPPTAD